MTAGLNSKVVKQLDKKEKPLVDKKYLLQKNPAKVRGHIRKSPKFRPISTLLSVG